jgi:hypothetical protein
MPQSVAFIRHYLPPCSSLPSPGVQSASTLPPSEPSHWLKFLPTVFVASCIDTALTLLGPSPRTGAVYRISCPSQCLAAKSPVYGCSRTNAFSAQSALCRSALQAGAYQNTNGGIFELAIVASTAASYCASGASSLFSSNAIAATLPPIILQHPYAFSLVYLTTPLMATCQTTFASVFVENNVPAPKTSSSGLRYPIQCPASACGVNSARVIGCLRTNYFHAQSTICAAAAHSFIEMDSVFQIVTAPSADASFCNETFNSIPSSSIGSPSSSIAWRFADAPAVMGAQSLLYSNANPTVPSPAVGEQIRAYCPPYLFYAPDAMSITGCSLQNVYTADSRACLVAVHGGVISSLVGGVFRAHVVQAPTYFCGVASNSVSATPKSSVPVDQLSFALQLMPNSIGMRAILLLNIRVCRVISIERLSSFCKLYSFFIADAIVHALPVTFFQKVSAAQFDVAFEILLGASICIRFTSLASTPDSNAYEVCSGMF